MTTLAELRTVKTREQWLADIIGLLNTAGFNAQSWQTGSVQRTLVEMFAYVANVMSEMVASVSYMAFNQSATGNALTELALSHYATARLTAVATRGTVRLTGAVVGPPHNVGVGELVVGTAAGITFRNLAAFTVPSGGTVDVAVEAEVAGSASNVANGTIVQMVTPLAGTTCTNLSNWITRNGSDEETDAALRLRNSAKWATLSIIEGIDDRYEYIARTALANCRVKVDSSNPDGPGTLRIYLAKATGTASGAEATAVNDAIALESLGGPAGATTPYHTTIAASATSIAITGTVFYDAGLTDAATCETDVEAAVTDYINAAPIGGYSYGIGANNIIDRDGIIDVIRSVTGVKKVTLSAPSGDTAITSYNVATAGTFTITYTAAT